MTVNHLYMFNEAAEIQLVLVLLLTYYGVTGNFRTVWSCNSKGLAR